MRIPIYIVDSFTNRLFAGNPAAVCPLKDWLDDALLQSIAAENNLSETAFLVCAGEGYALRWFTPKSRLIAGGLHLMLMQPRRTLRAGDRVSVELLFADGQRVSIDFEVRQGPPR